MILIAFNSLGLKSQNDCFYISSILVDACGTPEGPNEMLRLQLGSEPLDWTTMTIDFPNNNFLGICQNEITEQKVEALNSTIDACGIFIEPEDEFLPANADVLIITSVDFDPSAHDYSGLIDTIYVLFQCAGNTSGHFANWVNNCNENNGFRTTTVTFANGCTDVATYNRCFLTNQSGGIGGTPAERDGARADFSPTGEISYPNDGCTIAFQNIEVEISTNSVNGCSGDDVELLASISGDATIFNWYAEQDVIFSQEDSLQTNATLNELGNLWIYFSAENTCDVVETDSVLISVLSPPDFEIMTNAFGPICTEGDVILIVETEEDESILWSNNEIENSVTPNSEGWWIATVSNNCGSASDSVFISFESMPSCNILAQDTILICEDEEANVQANIENFSNIQWSNGGTENETTTSSSGWLVITVSNDCGICEDSVYIEKVVLDASFSLNPAQGEAPLSVEVNANSEGGVWFINEELQEDMQDVLFTEPGVYIITHEIFDEVSGCSDTFSEDVVVTFEEEEEEEEEEELEDDEILTMKIPNVFTPNNDGVNDLFGITANIAGSFDCSIINRWGNEILTINNITLEEETFTPIWNGTTSNERATEGVYFYKIVFKSSQQKEVYQGFVHLVRD